MGSERYIDIVFTGPPGPRSGRFVEVEDMDGHGIRVGTWMARPDGCWALRILALPTQEEATDD